MAIPNGKLYLLMNIDKRSDIAVEIATHLVQKYGITLSIVPDLQQVCPKCSQLPSDTDCSSSTAISEEHEHLEESASSSSNSTCSKIQEKSPESSRKRKIEEEIAPLMKRLIKEEEEEEEEVIDVEEANEVLGTVLATMQNGSGEVKLSNKINGHSEQSSDDGTSNSNDNFDADDDDYNPMWANTEFLANFITSQPDIFHANRVGNADLIKDTKMLPSNSEKKDRLPSSIVTSNGKTRRGRIVYSQQDLNILEEYYVEDPNACANPMKRDIMCNRLNVDYHRLKVWFQNRRRKDKVRSQEEAATSKTPEY